jgi:hypothetical protein
LRDTFPEIRKRQEHGQTIFGLNGAAGFLISKEITPDYQVLLDPQEEVTHLIAPAKAHLVASQCHPNVLAVLTDATLWHLAVEGAEAQVPDHAEDFCLTGGGFTVGLSAMPLAYALGYRKLHLYGYDSSAASDCDHAYGHHCVPEKVFHTDPVVTATMAGKKFKTSFAMAAQAKAFPKLCNDLIDRDCLITVNSAGLIMAVVEEMRKSRLPPIQQTSERN